MSNRYEASQAAAFMRSKELHGDLSNMTGGMPLTVNGIAFQSSEALYQALKYPEHPEIQRDIGSAGSGMDAKRLAYASTAPIRSDWDDVRVDAMRYTVAHKLGQNPGRFSAALLNTGDRPIVEKSYRDSFWGAKPQGQYLIGQNVLGKILTELRAELQAASGNAAQAARAFIAQTKTDNLFVNVRAVPAPARTR